MKTTGNTYRYPNGRTSRTWSLLDMLRFYALEFVRATRSLGQMGSFLSATAKMPLDEEATKSVAGLIVHVAEQARVECSRLPVSAATDALLGRLIFICREDKPDLRTIETTLTNLASAIDADLAGFVFLAIDPERAIHFEKPTIDDAVEAAFPGTQRQFSAASRCYALDEWTACVFHAIRAVQPAIERLAERLDTKSRPNTEEWGRVLQDIEERIRALEKASRNDRPDMGIFSEAALQMRFFKNAWRNDAMHRLEMYDERDADDVLRSVRRFLEILAPRFGGGEVGQNFPEIRLA